MISLGISEFGENEFSSAKIKEQQIDNFIYRRRRVLGEVFTQLEANSLADYNFKSLFTFSYITFHDQFATQSQNNFLVFTNVDSKDLLTGGYGIEVDATFPHGYSGVFSQTRVQKLLIIFHKK